MTATGQQGTPEPSGHTDAIVRQKIEEMVAYSRKHRVPRVEGEIDGVPIQQILDRRPLSMYVPNARRARDVRKGTNRAPRGRRRRSNHDRL